MLLESRHNERNDRTKSGLAMMTLQVVGMMAIGSVAVVATCKLLLPTESLSSIATAFAGVFGALVGGFLGVYRFFVGPKNDK